MVPIHAFFAWYTIVNGQFNCLHFRLYWPCFVLAVECLCSVYFYVSGLFLPFPRSK